MRKILGFGVLLGLLIALSSCGSLTGGRTVVSVEIELPAEVAEHQLVGVTVTAVGSEGSRPFRGFGGTVGLSASAGSLTVDGLDLANGRGTAEVRLSGAEGLVSIRATAGGINGLDRHGCRALTALQGDAGDPATEAIPDIWLNPPTPVPERRATCVFAPSWTEHHTSSLIGSGCKAKRVR